MRTKNLSRLLCAIDGTIYNDRTDTKSRKQ